MGGILGDAFLQDIRTLIAHPVSTNLFRSVHQHNFVACRICRDNYKFLSAHTENGSWGTRGGGFFVRVHLHKELTMNVLALKRLKEAFLKVHSDWFDKKSDRKVIDNCSRHL